jgi:hypothetical protein
MAVTYEPIATQTLASSAANITFSSIPATYTDLKLIVVGATTTQADALIRFNGDTATNYSYTRLSGNGTSPISSRSITQSAINITAAVSWNTTTPQFFEINIPSYAGSTNKTILSIASQDANGSGATELSFGLWRSTAAINSVALLVLTNAIAAGATATLYGIKAA